MSLLRFIIVLLLFDSIVLARKVKRKESYRVNVPPPPPQQQPQPPAPSSGGHAQSSPYEFEDVHHDEFPPHSPHGQISRYELDYASASSSGHSTAPGGSYLNDNGLRSIAKGSADQATSAVASQNAAGKQAAYVAKSTLAQAAAQAAGTVVAVLKGKEVLLRRLEEQIVESHGRMESELSQLQQAKRSAKAAQYSAQQAINHVSVLTAALNNAQAASELAQKSASEAAAELASQIDMVAQAKAKLEQVEAHVYAARLDYEETKDAAEKASSSAHAAQINANDAAVHANVELSESYTHHQQHQVEHQYGNEQYEHNAAGLESHHPQQQQQQQHAQYGTK